MLQKIIDGLEFEEPDLKSKDEFDAWMVQLKKYRKKREYSLKAIALLFDNLWH